MTAPCGGTAAEPDAHLRRALERLARELPAGASPGRSARAGTGLVRPRSRYPWPPPATRPPRPDQLPHTGGCRTQGTQVTDLEHPADLPPRQGGRSGASSIASLVTATDTRNE